MKKKIALICLFFLLAPTAQALLLTNKTGSDIIMVEASSFIIENNKISDLKASAKTKRIKNNGVINIIPNQKFCIVCGNKLFCYYFDRMIRKKSGGRTIIPSLGYVITKSLSVISFAPSLLGPFPMSNERMTEAYYSPKVLVKLLNSK